LFKSDELFVDGCTDGRTGTWTLTPALLAESTENDCNIGRNDPVSDVICTYINQVGDKIPKYNIQTSTNA